MTELIRTPVRGGGVAPALVVDHGASRLEQLHTNRAKAAARRAVS